MRRSLCVGVVVVGLVTLARGGRADKTPTPAASPPVTSPALRLPPPLVYDKSPDAPTPVVFRHATHVTGQRNQCLACHPQPFPMLRRERRAVHAEMDAARSCGTCHDGKRAFATNDPERCDRCHTGEEVKR